MTNKAQYSSLMFVVSILSVTMIIIMGSSLYLWFAVPDEMALKINGSDEKITTDHLLGTILQTTLEEEK